MTNTLEVSLSRGKEELGKVNRKVIFLDGIECVIYHCKFYELRGWALWERYIDLNEPLLFTELTNISRRIWL